MPKIYVVTYTVDGPQGGKGTLVSAKDEDDAYRVMYDRLLHSHHVVLSVAEFEPLNGVMA